MQVLIGPAGFHKLDSGILKFCREARKQQQQSGDLVAQQLQITMGNRSRPERMSDRYIKGPAEVFNR